jgi:TctA family transporter
MFELSVRQSIIISHGNPLMLLDHPTALTFLALTALATWHLGRRQVAPTTG